MCFFNLSFQVLFQIKDFLKFLWVVVGICFNEYLGDICVCYGLIIIVIQFFEENNIFIYIENSYYNKIFYFMEL